MVVAASAVGLGRVQLPRQRATTTTTTKKKKKKKKRRTTMGRRREEKEKEGKRNREKQRVREKRDGALQYRDHAGLRTQDGPDY